MASGPQDANASCNQTMGCGDDDNNDECTDCEGNDTGNCDDHSSSSYSAFPIRYATGEVRLVTQDLDSTDFGLPWGHTRSYSNRVTAPDEGINGSSWFVKEVPQLANINPDPNDPNKATICVIRVINDAIWFDYIAASNTYAGRFFTYDTLTHDAVNQQFLLTDSRGQITKFFNFDAGIPAAKRGQFKSFVDAFGRETVASYGANNLIGSFVQTVGASTAGYYYDYYASGVNTNRLQYVTYKTGGNNIRRAKYDYYDGTDTFGSAGDLKRATIQEFKNNSWGTLSVWYYRYYKAGDPDGFAHGLRYVLSPLNYAKMVTLGITPEIATDSQLSGFAKNCFRYNSDKSVKTEAVNGGVRLYDFSKSLSGNASGYNNWKTKTVEVLPDGNQNIVYTNYAGRPMLKVFLKTGTSEKWYSYFQYDTLGRVSLRTESSAVASYSEASPGLVTLNSGSGIIRLYDYYSATPPAGGAPNWIQYEKLKQGSSGTAIKLREWQYTARTAASVTIYVPWKEIVYQSDAAGGSNPAETVYTYTWQGNFQIDQRTTTWPVVSVGQNGTGLAESRVEAFDAYGRVIWLKDERGYITGFTYDLITGGLTKKVEDASVGTPWTPLAGAHLNLTTDYTLDNLGRVTQELGPIHDVDVNGTSTTLRRAKWRVYLDDLYEQWEGFGYQKTSDGSYTLINPVNIVKKDNAGRVTDLIQAVRSTTSGPLTSSDTFPQTSWVRWTRKDYQNSFGLASQSVYFLIPTSGTGTLGVNYDQAGYGYDIMKRPIREQSPGGTVTRTVYHPRGWVLERWTGTNDAGATDSDPSGGGALGNNMVKVESSEYDNNAAGQDGNLTKETKHVDATITRVTAFGYDWRNRRTSIDGEIDFYQAYTYDNRDRIVQVDRRNTTAAGNLIGRSATNYDNRGRIYQTITYGVDPSTGTVGNSLTNNTWYDPAGNTLKQQNAGSNAFQKSFYDQVNRLIKQYTAYDNGTGDVVMQQTEITFDAANNGIKQIVRLRFHDATGTGELTSPGGAQPKARVSYQASWPDPLGRPKNAADYGTNGANDLVRPATAPARSDTVLVTTTDYNNRGEGYQVTDPKGTVNQVTLDDAARVTKRIENYVSGGTGADQNRETDYVYNADGRVRTLTAKNSTTGDQVTRYVYGTTLADSDIASNDLLRAVIYPDSTDSYPPLSGTDHVEFKYNRLGEIKEKKDQLQTVHVYEYDKLGRQIHDRVTTLGTGVDGAIRRVSRTYEVRGLNEKTTSYDNATVGAGTVVNEIQAAYNSFSQLVAEYQSHAGAVNTGTTSKVQSGYANGSANQIRPTSWTYPNGRVLTFNYGTAGGMGDSLSRVGAIIDSDAGATHLADYTYVGLNDIVEAASPQPGTKLTYIKQGAEPVGDGGDQYTGWDRFSRVIDQRWIKTSTGAALERVQYGFDRANNRQWRDNLVAASGQDEYYTYDGLYQLKVLQRGDLNAGKTGISGTPVWQEDFTFDPTGNWNNYLTKVSGTTSLNQNRTHNPANEIATIAGSSTLITQDLAGHITRAPKPTNWSAAYDLTYDAWDRLVKIMDGATTVAIYAYDGKTRRILKTVSGTTRHFYYSDQWQILEERTGTATTANRHFVWGLRYPDDLVLRDRDTTGGGTLNERLYTFHDYFNPTAVADTTGAVLERYGYDAFGQSRVMTPAFGSRATSSYDWETRYGAYRWDNESNLYQVRNRYLHPTLGRWLTRDPIEYEDGLNLYKYVANNATNYVDIDGLQMGPPGGGGWRTGPCTPAESRICMESCKAKGEPTSKCTSYTRVSPTGGTRVIGCDCSPCTPARIAALQILVDAACDIPRTCEGITDCKELLARATLNTLCAEAREKINKECFHGGDPGHIRAAAEARKSADNCVCKWTKLCFDPGMMA